MYARPTPGGLPVIPMSELRQPVWEPFEVWAYGMEHRSRRRAGLKARTSQATAKWTSNYSRVYVIGSTCGDGLDQSGKRTHLPLRLCQRKLIRRS